VLCYGDYPQLAKRCLTSIAEHARPGSVAEVIVICNVVSPATLAVIEEIRSQSLQVPSRVVIRTENPRKYPAMREVFHGTPQIATQYVMWFDDDSCIRPGFAGSFFDYMAGQLNQGPSLFVGQPWRWPLSAAQQQWIPTQPWYCGRPIKRMVTFGQGAWWIMAMSLIRDVDWPPENFEHSGGDVMTGVMLDQREIPILRLGSHFVAINANNEDLLDSVGNSRGITKAQEPPIGTDYRAAT